MAGKYRVIIGGWKSGRRERRKKEKDINANVTRELARIAKEGKEAG